MTALAARAEAFEIGIGPNSGQLRSRIEAHLAGIHRSRCYSTMHSDKQPRVIAD
jgi:hypothetical protein